MILKPWPWVKRTRLIIAETNRARMEDALDRYRIWHWNRCGCHDSWDQCPCSETGHPIDRDCGCCDLGTGLCGPKPTKE